MTAAKRIRVVIADDEPLARERLRTLLVDRGDYEVVAECEDGAQAVEAIAAARPDLVLLDIRMPELDGLDVAAALDDGAPPMLVFVTAHDEFALRAFDVRALDYVLKPIDRERFHRTLERVEGRLREREGGTQHSGLDPSVRAILDSLRPERQFPARFLVRDSRGMYFVRVDEIDWVDAQGNYVRLHAQGRPHLVRDTMKAFEGKLDPASFVRVHRSAIVNIDRIQRVEPYAHGEYTLTLRDGTRLTSSRAHSARLRALLG